MLDRIALILTIIGALNWGSIGLFRFDFVAWIFGGQDALVSRIVYTIVALAGIWCISLLFRERDTEEITGDIKNPGRLVPAGIFYSNKRRKIKSSPLRRPCGYPRRSLPVWRPVPPERAEAQSRLP